MLVLGIDPGEHLGWCLLDCGSVERHLASGVTDDVRLHRNDLVLGSISIPLLGAQAPAVVGIETVPRVYRRAGFGTQMATGLARAERRGGNVEGIAKAHGVAVVDVSAATWRKLLVGSRSASDAAVKRAIVARVKLWPPASQNHARDAAGVAIYAAATHRLASMRVTRPGA